MSLLDSMLRKFTGIDAMEIEVPMGNVLLYMYPLNAYDEFYITRKIESEQSAININYFGKLFAICISTMYISSYEGGEKILVADDLGVTLSSSERDDAGNVKPFSEWSRKAREDCASKLYEKLKLFPSRFIDQAYSVYSTKMLELEVDLQTDRLDAAVKDMVETGEIKKVDDKVEQQKQVQETEQPKTIEQPIVKEQPVIKQNSNFPGLLHGRRIM